MAIAKVPVAESDITLDWARTVLSSRLESIRTGRIGEAYGLSSKLYRARLSGTGVPSSVVVKLSESERPADLREVPFYSTFGPRLGIRVPHCHHGDIDSNHSVLILEDFEHATQGDCLDALDEAGAAAMARVLAILHATWRESPELAAAEWLPPMSVRRCEWLLSRREQCLTHFADRLTPLARELLDRVESVNAEVEKRLAGAPHTLLHADLHLDNVLFDGGTERPVLLDWARVARGPAAIDLVELMFLMSPDAEKALGIYVEEIRRRGVKIDEVALRDQIGGALLRRFISATCGVSRWEPGSERERALVAVDQARIFRAIEAWRNVDSLLFD